MTSNKFVVKSFNFSELKTTSMKSTTGINNKKYRLSRYFKLMVWCSLGCGKFE